MSKVRRLTVAAVFVMVVLLVVTACSTAPVTTPSDFGLVFKYGVGARNELDTFHGTYTKDMIGDPPITIPMTLSEEELDRIYEKMVNIGFFDYPDEFEVTVPPGGLRGIVAPHSSYYFKVKQEDGFKELSWDAEIIEATTKDEKAERLRELIRLIRDIIEAKPEYRELPEPTSGYM